MNITGCVGNCTDVVSYVNQTIPQVATKSWLSYVKVGTSFFSKLWEWIGEIASVSENFAPYKVIFGILIFILFFIILKKLWGR